MKKIPVVCYDSFASRPGMGNPCGVVFDADTLTSDEMQSVAYRVGFNECAFLCKTAEGGLRLRFFMPGKETPLCGHGTVCALAAFMSRQKPTAPQNLLAETMAGTLQLGYDPATTQVTMQQTDARFEPFRGNAAALLDAIGLTEDCLDTKLPILYGSTGSWTVILPLKDRLCFGRMKPRNKEFAALLAQHPDASIHPICRQTLHPECTLHGRHFSSTASGSVEDPVTGTACGVMGAYYLNYMCPEKPAKVDLLIEQGQDMGRDGIVRVWAEAEDKAVHVRIAGSAVAGETLFIEI